MNVVQMLNFWRWVTLETEEPIVFRREDAEHYPMWFWATHEGCGISWFKPKLAIVIGVNMSDTKHENYPIYFYGDTRETYISYIMNEEFKAKDTPRTWLSRKEDAALGIHDC